jgi:hypothetical protein
VTLVKKLVRERGYAKDQTRKEQAMNFLINLLAKWGFLKKDGGLNGSMQHLLGVYWPEFQSPKFFLDVD